MSRFSRILTLGLLPLFTLLLGWQIGIREQRAALTDMERRLELLYSGGTQSGAVLGDPEDSVDLSLMWGVWRLLQTQYIEPDQLNASTMVMGAVAGMVESIGDPYTLFMTPKENTDFRDSLSGHLQGIGAELDLRDGRVVVVSPIKGSPAQAAGILPEDMIVQVDEEDIADLSLQEVVTKIRGPKGTRVTLGILRENEDQLLSITITRDNITIPSAEYHEETTEEGVVGYLAINQFGTETIGEITEILRDIDPADIDGLIVDLRFNGGGYLDGAVELASIFLREGTVVTVEGREGAKIQKHDVSGRPLLPDIPLVVLINEGTASASEIVAGALQDHDRATIIGMKSFGKGTVQEVIDLPGGSSLRVTIARWLTPDGRDLGKDGVTPDYAIDRTRANFEAGEDPQLDAALEWLTEGTISLPLSGTGATAE